MYWLSLVNRSRGIGDDHGTSVRMDSATLMYVDSRLLLGFFVGFMLFDCESGAGCAGGGGKWRAEALYRLYFSVLGCVYEEGFNRADCIGV